MDLHCAADRGMLQRDCRDSEEAQDYRFPHQEENPARIFGTRLSKVNI